MPARCAGLDVEQQIGTEEPFVEQRDRVAGDCRNELGHHRNLPLAVEADGGVGQDMRACVHQGDQTQHRIRRLAIRRGIARAEVRSEFRRVLRPKQRAIGGKNLQAMPLIVRVALISPAAGTAFKKPLHRRLTEPLPGLGKRAFGQQFLASQTIGANIEAPSDFKDWLGAKECHTHHQPQHHVRRQATPPNARLRR